MRVGFIGLGAMGLPMTQVLAQAGHDLRVYDQAPAARERASAIARVTVAAGVGEVVGAVESCFTCVPNDATVRALYLAAGGILEACRQGGARYTVDCSTVSPSVTREVAAALADAGVTHLDASMLGSVPQAQTGQIGFVVGGERAGFEAVEPLLQTLGRMVRHVGAPGSANQVKLIHQTLVAGHAVAVAEALALATGTDLDAFFDVVCNGGGFAHSRYFENRTPRLRSGDYSPLFALDLMAKDAGLGQALARDVGLATPVLDQVMDVFDRARAAGFGGDDFSAVARVYEAALGRRLADS